MPERKEAAQIDYYVGLVIRRRWLVIIPFCLAMVIGISLALILEPAYEASTLILVEPQRVPTEYVKSIVSTDIETRISTISQQILSRSNLEKIIADFTLFSRPEDQSMFMEDKLKSLRKQIKVEVTRARQISDAFTITYLGNSPKKTMNIANALAAHFIDANLKIREDQASGTSSFLDAELATMKQQLQEVEGQLSVFRNKFMGELPEQLDSNLRLLGTLENQLSDRQERLREERSRLYIVINEIEQLRREAQSVRRAPVGNSEARQPDGPLSLAQLKEQLAGMRAGYTERHPDVVRLKKMIADLEAKGGEEKETAGRGDAAPAGDSQEAITSPALKESTRRRMVAEASISNLQTEINQINQQIREYRLRIEKTPHREEQLMGLKRDYDNIQKTYVSLLGRKHEADIALNMEKKKKGEQFRILDYAKLPEKPVSPDIVRLFVMFTAGGLGLGLGLVFLLDSLNATFRRPDEIETDLGIRVLATIPRVFHARDKMFGRLNAVLTAVAVLVASALAAGFGMLAFDGIQPTIEILQRYVSI